MITKERLLQHIEKFPPQFTIDELIDKLLFINKLENRIKQSNNSDTISNEELEKDMKEWIG